MPAPVINPLSSLLVPFLGERWNFKPAASNEPTRWRELIPLFAFTADSSTNLITALGTAFADGERVRVTTSGALPGGLTPGAYYFVRDASGASFKLSAAPGGSAIDLTDTGTGTHHIGYSGLPPGLNLNNVSGEISGTPTEKGVFAVTLVASNDFLGASFSADPGTDLLTLDGSPLLNGERVRLSTNGTLPSGLSAATDYFVRDADGSTLKLSSTVGGGAINITDSGSGTHRIGKESDGDSPAVVFPIGVRDARALLDAAIALEWDWDTNLVRPLGGQPSVNSEQPILYLKNGDKVVLAIRFVKGALPFAPDATALVAGIRDEDEEPLVAKSDGSFGESGSGPDRRYFLLLDMTDVPVGGQSVTAPIENQAGEGPDVIKAWLELRLTYNYDVLKSGSSVELDRACRSIPVKIARSLLAT